MCYLLRCEPRAAGGNPCGAAAEPGHAQAASQAVHPTDVPLYYGQVRTVSLQRSVLVKLCFLHRLVRNGPAGNGLVM